MRNYLLNRIAMLVPTLIGMSMLIFLMLRLLPGDIVDIIAGSDAQTDSASRAKLRQSMGLSDPIPTQYVKWVWQILHGNPGNSLRSGKPVGQLLLRSLPVTLELALLGVVIATVIAIPLGVITAVKRDTGVDFFSRILGLIGLSLPNFWLATLLLLFTSKFFHWIPPLKHIALQDDPVGNLKQFMLPALAVAVQMMAIIMRMTRTSMLEVMGQDYVRTARAKGLHGRAVIQGHALRNALIPVATVIGFQLGALMGSSAIVEVVFGLNGIGFTLLQAIFNRDYPLVQAAALYLAVVFVLINLTVDLLYTVLDPRIKQG